MDKALETHDIVLTSAPTEMGFTQSSVWGFVVAKLRGLIYDVPHKTRMDTRKGSWGITLERILAPGFPHSQLCWRYYLSSAEGVGDMDQMVVYPRLYSSYPYMSSFRSHLFLTTHQVDLHVPLTGYVQSCLPCCLPDRTTNI